MIVREKRFMHLSEEEKNKILEKDKENSTKGNLIVFESSTTNISVAHEVAEYVYNKLNVNNKAMLLTNPYRPSLDPNSSYEQIMNSIYAGCIKVAKWYRNEVKPYLNTNTLIVIGSYHIFEAVAHYIESQIAIARYKMRVEQNGKNTKGIPFDGADMGFIHELRQKVTDHIVTPDALFMLFDSNNSEDLTIKISASSLFSLEPYCYIINSFYGVDQIKKEVDIRLERYNFN